MQAVRSSMSENSAQTHAGTDFDASPSSRADGADLSMTPDMAPMANAFDTLNAFGLAAPDGPAPAMSGWRMGLGRAGRAMAAVLHGIRPPVLARIPGRRRHWMLAGLIAGSAVLGALASGGVAWKAISDRDAQIAARTANLDLQSTRIAEQDARIAVLTRAMAERPLPEPRVTDTADAPAAPAAAPAPQATETHAAVSPAPATPVVRPAAVAAPSIAGSGICDVPFGSDAAPRMRRCLDWFAGRDTSSMQPVP
jgi:hypothetical protein